jgi:hypothetical protein
MDDTARKVLGTTSMPHNKTKCMRAILAENVSEPPTNVGKLPRGLEIGGSRGGPPALHRTPRACEGGKGGERWSGENSCNQAGRLERNARGCRWGARGRLLCAGGGHRGRRGPILGPRLSPINTTTVRRRKEVVAGEEVVEALRPPKEAGPHRSRRACSRRAEVLVIVEVAPARILVPSSCQANRRI